MNLFKEIRDILTELLDIEEGEIYPESYLVRDLGVESIDFLELAVTLSTRFKIAVHDDTVFLRNLRLHVSQAEEQGRAPVEVLQEQYRFLTTLRLEAMLADLDHGPVLQVQDLEAYTQWQMTSVKAA